MPDPNLTLSLTLTLTVTLTVTRSCLLYWPTNYQQFAVLLPCCSFFWSWACNHVETTPGMAGEPGPSGRRAQAADWPRLAGAWRSLRRDLALREAYGDPAGRGLSHLVSHIGVPGQSPVPQQPVPQQMDRCRWAGGVPAQLKPPWQ